MDTQTRFLSQEEQQAAEAAFRGYPIDPSWSEQARTIYQGIVSAQTSRGGVTVPNDIPGSREACLLEGPSETDTSLSEGLFVDVSPIAGPLGLPLTIALSHRLWEEQITDHGRNSSQAQFTSIRDILVALRLHLATQPQPIPQMDFPALVSFPSDPLPQVIPLHAVIWGDPVGGWVMTVYLPDETTNMLPPSNA